MLKEKQMLDEKVKLKLLNENEKILKLLKTEIKIN